MRKNTSRIMQTEKYLKPLTKMKYLACVFLDVSLIIMIYHVVLIRKNYKCFLMILNVTLIMLV